MATHALATLGAIVIAVLLFSIPLILKFHVYKPEVTRVAIGDEVTIYGRISSVWCQAVDLSSKSSFQTFMYEMEPEVNEKERERTVSTHQITLPNKALEYWGFHLLTGSRVSIWSCARLIGADLTIVKGYGALHRCLLEHRHRIKGNRNDDASGEDSESESESDDVTSSISSSQGAVSNETNKMYVCKSASHHVRLPDSHSLKRQTKKDSVTSIMKWDDLAHYLTDASTGNGRCDFAAIHSVEDGACLGRHPKDAQQLKDQEVAMLQKSFRDPSMLYSSGIILRDVKFTFVKVEGKALLGRTSGMACLVMMTEKVYIVCIYRGEELTKYVFRNCLNVIERMNQGS